ncbi:MAG: DUF922 domain-containing Zn-dependent protease [Pseudomonas sp.]|nr:DUF922 domain-containing Zn-dependent protease [Pseudomonas sp.]
MRRFLLLLALAPLVQAAEPVSSTVREQHYMVFGRTIDDIQRSIIERTPVRNAWGAFAGNTKSHYKTTYRLVPVAQTGCVLRNAEVKVESVVTLPQLAPGTLSPAVAAEWRRYYTALRTHEYLHVESARESARTTQQWLAGMQIGGPCHAARPHVRVAIEAYILKLDERDRQLDALTDHGRAQGAWLDARAR